MKRGGRSGLVAVTERPQKISFGEMREMGVRGLLIAPTITAGPLALLPAETGRGIVRTHSKFAEERGTNQGIRKLLPPYILKIEK
jgi:hypothetical protein